MDDDIVDKLISAFEIALLKFDEMGSEAKKKDQRIRDLEAQVKAK